MRDSARFFRTVRMSGGVMARRSLSYGLRLRRCHGFNRLLRIRRMPERSLLKSPAGSGKGARQQR
jgi:hypothetical protein